MSYSRPCVVGNLEVSLFRNIQEERSGHQDLIKSFSR